MSPQPVLQPVVATTQIRDCSIALRRVEGPEADELFFLIRPLVESADAGPQAEAIYRALLQSLEGEGASFDSIVAETVFLKNLPTHIESVRAARRRVVAENGGSSHRPASSEVEQPPLYEGAWLEVAVHAVVPHGSVLRVDVFEAPRTCGCGECARSHALRVQVGGETRLYAGGLCGRGANAYEQTLAMFAFAESLLEQAGMTFREVVRTWIHLREMDRDYADLNRARREFFESRGIDPVPASTGIGGGPVSPEHDLCLGIYAIQSQRPPPRTIMTTPTLNEAAVYGADFVRGMRVAEANKDALYVSGTASIDEGGRTAHPGDFDAQVDRMLLNIASLLEGQGAGFGDVVSAVTYLKHPADAQRLREKFLDAGFEGFPTALVAARVCRPELLCETEALAVLPGAARRPVRDGA